MASGAVVGRKGGNRAIGADPANEGQAGFHAVNPPNQTALLVLTGTGVIMNPPSAGIARADGGSRHCIDCDCFGGGPLVTLTPLLCAGGPSATAPGGGIVPTTPPFSSTIARVAPGSEAGITMDLTLSSISGSSSVTADCAWAPPTAGTSPAQTIAASNGHRMPDALPESRSPGGAGGTEACVIMKDSPRFFHVDARFTRASGIGG